MTLGLRRRAPDPDLAEQLEWAEREAADHGWQRLEAADLERYGRKGVVLHRPSGLLFEPVLVDLGWPAGARALVVAYCVDDSGAPRFLRRPASGSTTLAQDEALAAERRRKDEERQQAEQRRLAAQPRRLVTLAWLEDWPQPMTLRAAVQAIADVQGDVREQDGELLVELPERPPQPERVRRACRVVFAAREAVRAEIRAAPGLPAGDLAERLPDLEPRAGGGVA